jgi:hypothetical protein
MVNAFKNSGSDAYYTCCANSSFSIFLALLKEKTTSMTLIGSII